MKAATKKKTQKVTKNRLICITLPESLLEASKSYRRKTGFNSMSELLRATIEHATAATLKSNVPEPRTQISFRLTDALYGTLVRASSQSGQSIARIIRTLLENAPKIGILPPGVPAKYKTASAAKNTKKTKAQTAGTPAVKTNSAGAKKTASAGTKKTASPKKSSPKPTSAKSVPAKKSAKTVPSAGTKKSAAKKSSRKSASGAAKRRSR